MVQAQISATQETEAGLEAQGLPGFQHELVQVQPGQISKSLTQLKVEIRL